MISQFSVPRVFRMLPFCFLLPSASGVPRRWRQARSYACPFTARASPHADDSPPKPGESWRHCFSPLCRRVAGPPMRRDDGRHAPLPRLGLRAMREFRRFARITRLAPRCYALTARLRLISARRMPDMRTRGESTAAPKTTASPLQFIEAVILTPRSWRLGDFGRE